jgi:hypothetical protein
MSHKTMSLSALRWRENRVREELYKEHVKHSEALANGAGRQGSNGTTLEPDGQTPEALRAQGTPNRRKACPLSGVILPPPLTCGAVGLWYWVALCQLESAVDEPHQATQA